VQPVVFPHPDFADHALLDSGEGEKLERFGTVVLRRPDPQALWHRRAPREAWDAAHLSFVRESDRGGRWEVGATAPPEARGEEAQWPCRFGGATFLIRPTPFKHVGLFPEQATNWRFLLEAGAALDVESPRLLNLFGYTGAASVLAAGAGYQVTHVDASRLAVRWTRENLQASGLPSDALRLLCDDALAFARRQRRRGERYEGVLLDPPHYGRGPRGQKWQLERDLAPLLDEVAGLLAQRSFLVLSTYAVGYSPLAFVNLLTELGDGVHAGELALPEGDGERRLPGGLCARAWRGLDLSGAS